MIDSVNRGKNEGRSHFCTPVVVAGNANSARNGTAHMICGPDVAVVPRGLGRYQVDTNRQQSSRTRVDLSKIDDDPF